MNKFITFIINNQYFTLISILLIIVYGFLSLSNIKLTQDPELLTPRIFMDLYLPGASPADVERNVIFPIETELRRISQINQIKSKIVANYGHIFIEFEYGVDLEQKIKQIESKINNIKRRLPNTFYFNIEKSLLSDYLSPFVLGVTTNKNTPYAAHDLAIALETIDQLKRVTLIEPEQNIVIALDINKMHNLGISTTQITQAVQASNTFLPNHKINIDGRYFQITGPNSQYQHFQDLDQTQLYSADGNPVKLSNIANITKQPITEKVISRYQNKDMRFIKINMNNDVNIIFVKQKIADTIANFQLQSHHQNEVVFIFDQSQGVYQIVFSLLNNLFQGMVILFFVLLFSVGYRSTVIIVTILPLSFLVAMTGLSLTNYGIQQTSIAGFIIALGLIVDNGIVVTENAFILNNYQKLSHRDAAIQGTSAAIYPLLASTITTVLAFVPIFLLTTDAGLYIRSLAVSIWLTLFASLFVSITLITLLLARIGTRNQVPYLPTLPSFLVALIPFRENIYAKLVTLVVRYRYVVMVLFILVFIYSLFMGSRLPVQLFPPVGNPYFTINVTTPEDMDEIHKDEIAKAIESHLHSLNEIDSVATIIGSNFPFVDPTIQYLGDIVLLVKTKFNDETGLNQLISGIKLSLKNLLLDADINLSLFQFNDHEYQSAFTVQLLGSDINTLNTTANHVLPILQKIEGITLAKRRITSEKIMFKLDFLHARAEALGIHYYDVIPLINQLTYGTEITRFRNIRGQEFPVLLKINTDANNLATTLRQIEVTSTHGQTVPLSEVIHISLQMQQTQINHQQFQPIVEIECWIDTSANIDQITDNVLKNLVQINRPNGVFFQIGGSFQNKKETFDGLGKNVIFIAILIFSVFVLQFKSFLQPLIIFFAVPLSIIGAIIALVLTGQTLSFLAAIGITSLMGIVVNDSILLVDEANKLLKQTPEKPIQDIAIEAAKKRFMPVLLTSITTISSLIPLALGNNVFKPMAITIIGGLVSSTLLILLFVPALYANLSRKKSCT